MGLKTQNVVYNRPFVLESNLYRKFSSVVQQTRICIINKKNCIKYPVF